MTENRMLNLVLFGPPGAGKGTQSENLINKYNLVHLSTGDILRSEITRGTALGKKAKEIMDRGELVSDDIVIGMIESKIDENPNAKGFIFDGFPRTTGQAVALDDLLQKKGTGISGMLALEVDNDELLKRLLLRGKNSGRPDDQNETIIRRRIEEYNSKTLPLKEYYSEQGKFHSIHGIGTVEEIFKSLVDRITFLKAEMDLTSLETDLEHLDLTIQDFEVADDIAPELLLEIDAIKRAEAEEAEESRASRKKEKKQRLVSKTATKNQPAVKEKRGGGIAKKLIRRAGVKLITAIADAVLGKSSRGKKQAGAKGKKSAAGQVKSIARKIGAAKKVKKAVKKKIARAVVKAVTKRAIKQISKSKLTKKAAKKTSRAKPLKKTTAKKQPVAKKKSAGRRK